MNVRRSRIACLAVMVCVAAATHAWAQQPPPPPAATPQGLSGSAGFGLSLTQGNSDTLNINATVDSVYDPKTGNVMKWNALYLRGKQNGVLAVNRVSGTFRDENTVSGRMFVFAEMDALHDTFKAIDYLLAPAVGVGVKAIDTAPTKLAFDVGVGGVVEKDTDFVARGSATVTFDQKLIRQLSETTTLKETLTGLFKTDNFSDNLLTLQAGIAARVNSRLQLTVDLLDTFKNLPVFPEARQNDVAIVTGVLMKY